MKVNDYVRTNNGLIFKIVGGNEDNWQIDILYSTLEFFEDTWLELYQYNDNGGWFIKENCKYSPNIIDLIEVGDYVNGERVINIIKKYKYLEVSDEEIIIYEKDIKSILTKEQFERCEYKI